MAIVIGPEAEGRGTSTGGYNTLIAKDGPANASGTITSVEIWALAILDDCKVGIFYITNGNTLKCRSVAPIGVVIAGSKRVFPLDPAISVETGDYIGIYYTSGSIEADSSGYAGMWYVIGEDHLAVDDEYTYLFASGYAISVHGIGEEVGAPDPPTNVAATDGVHTDKVVITWTKSAGATKYEVFRDAEGLGELGDVDTYDDSGADAPTITPGTAAATDGLTAHVTLSLAGESANNGTTHTYTVKAWNAQGWSDASGSDTGYVGVGSLTYQWQISAADSDADYSNISGGTTEPYNHAVAFTSGRYYKCVENATGAAEATSSADRGWRKHLPVADGDLIGIGIIRKS